MRLLVIFMAICISALAWAQDFSERPLQKLIDCPSAGGPEKGSYDFELRTYPDGGVLAAFTIGMFNRFAIGLSYGGAGVIGYANPDWNPQPGVVVSYRIFNESLAFPALSLGFNNQGYGAWIDNTNRYQFKAKGFYAVVGKNFLIGSFGELGGHFGANSNPMVDDDEGSLDFFAAIDYHMTEQLAFIAEYSAALNDNDNTSIGEGKGYMNFGVRWTFAERLAIDLHLRDMLLNQNNKDIRPGRNFGREIRISYVEHL